MAQLNDLLVLGKSNLIGDVQAIGSVKANSFTSNSATVQSNLYLNNGAQYGRLYINGAGTACTTAGTAGTTGSTIMILGNSTPVSSTVGEGADNACGILRIFATDEKYAQVRAAAGMSSSKSTYLRNWGGKDGYFVATTTTSAVGDANKPVYVNADGVVTACTAYSGLFTSMAWDNRKLSLTIGGTSKNASIPTTLTGFSSITSTSFVGALSGNATTATTAKSVNFAYDRDTSNYKDIALIYKADGTTVQSYIGAHNTPDAASNPSTSGTIIINPQYTTGNRWDTDANSGEGIGLVVGRSMLTYYNKAIFHTGNYKNIIISNGLNAPIIITNTTSKPSKGTDIPILKAKYQNASGNYYTVDVISAIGTGATNINNGCMRIGSNSGSVALTAGDSGKDMISTKGLSNTDNLYLITDSSIECYVGCDTVSAAVKALEINSSGKATFANKVTIPKLITSNYGTGAPSGTADTGTVYFRIIS